MSLNQRRPTDAPTEPDPSALFCALTQVSDSIDKGGEHKGGLDRIEHE